MQRLNKQMIRFFRFPKVFQYLFPNRLWKVKDEKSVYLTFDDGPTDTTDWVLDYLKNKGIKATFFCVGENAERNPEKYSRIVMEGHAVGNHTMRHEKASNTSVTNYSKSISEAAEILNSKLFRPPYGRLPVNYMKSIPKDMKVVMWSWLSYDFDKRISVERIIKRAESIKPGDVLVFHDNEKVGQRIREILPPIIELIQQKGLSFKTISV